MIVYLIQMTDTGGRPLYYDPEAGRKTGHGTNGWTEDAAMSIGFATSHDAQRFIEASLLRIADICRPVAYSRSD